MKAALRGVSSAVVLGLIVLGVFALAVPSEAIAGKGKDGGGDDCPRTGYFCPTYYAPVLCDDGKIYSNECFAWIACATGCEPIGPGPIPLPF